MSGDATAKKIYEAIDPKIVNLIINFNLNGSKLKSNLNDDGS